VAVASQKFYCIILKGGDRHPYFPRPLLNEFEFSIPFAGVPAKKDETNGESDDAAQGITETARLEELYLRHNILHAQQADLIFATHATSAQRLEAQRSALEADKVLLQLIAGESRDMKALEIVKLLKDSNGSGKMLEAAGKVAGRFGRDALRARIMELVESRLMGLDNVD